jgi:hypothetical protein
MIVAFRSAKVASVIATCAEKKATHVVALAIGSQPICESFSFRVFRGGDFVNKAILSDSFPPGFSHETLCLRFIASGWIAGRGVRRSPQLRLDHRG